MLTKKNLMTLLIPLLLVAAMFPISAAAQQGNDDGGERTASKPVFDRRFIDFMVPAHQAVIEIAQLGIQRTTREELRAFLVQQAEAAQAENELMLEWREAWYGSDNVPPLTAVPLVPETPEWEMGVRTVDLTVHLQNLNAVNPALFDQFLIDTLILLNGTAIEASLVTRHHDDHEEIYQLAKRMSVEHAAANLKLMDMRNRFFYNIVTPVTPVPSVTPVGTTTPVHTPTPVETTTPVVTTTPVRTVTVTSTPYETGTATSTPFVTGTVPAPETPGVTETVPVTTGTPVISTPEVTQETSPQAP